MLSPHVRFDPSVPRFTWDEETFARGLDTESRARADAANGEPPADAGNCRFPMDVRTATRQVAGAARTELEKHRSMVNDSLRLPDADADFLREQDESLADMHQICLSGIDSAEPAKTRVKRGTKRVYELCRGKRPRRQSCASQGHTGQVGDCRRRRPRASF